VTGRDIVVQNIISFDTPISQASAATTLEQSNNVLRLDR